MPEAMYYVVERNLSNKRIQCLPQWLQLLVNVSDNLWGSSFIHILCISLKLWLNNIIMLLFTRKFPIRASD